MKMNFLFGHVFWGILLLLWGISLILRGFNIVNLPLVKIFIAVIIILFGVKLLLGGWGGNSGENHRGSILTAGTNEYNSVFGSQTIDLTSLDPNSHPLEITAIFGSSFVKLPNDIDFEIQPTAIFGSASVPPKPQLTVPPAGNVKIEANAIFGRVEFVYKDPSRNGYRPAAPDSTKGASSDSL